MGDQTTDITKQERYRDARSSGTYDQIWQSTGKCVFCDLRDKYIFFEEHGVVMTISLYAYIDGHFLIMPRRHIRSPRELTQLEWDTIRKFSYIAKKLIKEVHGINGMQLVEKDGHNAQSTVNEHIHFHAIPFDAPDLCQWNYRRLKYTPLENVAMYKQARKQIIDYAARFERKYHQPHGLPLLGDLIIRNRKREILFQERPSGAKLSPDVITLPGGLVENFTRTVEEEVAREVYEETGLKVNPKDFRLLASRIGTTPYEINSRHLEARYTKNRRNLWNTYLLDGFDLGDRQLVPGDDCSEIVWIPQNRAQKHPRISDSVKAIIASLP